MNPYDELDLRARSATSIEDAARVLYDLLSGGYSIWTDGNLYSIKQLVAHVHGLQINIYSNEHSPPHFHVKSPDIDASFTIDNCTFMYGNIDNREKKLVRWWYERSKPILIKTWNSTRPTNFKHKSINK